jgi:N-acyl-D-amino-acid deacylase
MNAGLCKIRFVGILDIVVKDGLMIDGSGREERVIDVGIKGDKIEAIGNLNENLAGKVINARGLVVSPGFIDSHSHSEFTILADSRAKSKVMQGVTTEINGNCGLSAAPLIGESREQREGDFKELGIKERWTTFSDYFSILERRGLGLNFATLVGHGNIRASVIGYNDRHPSKEEMRKMEVLLEDALKDGAVGMSTGLCYPPGIYSSTEEIIGLSKILPKYRGIFTSHIRSEGDRLLESVDEVIRVGKEAETPIHISHLKTSGEKNWSKIDALFDLIDGSRDEGVDITCDRYPYIASSTDLDAILPYWTYEGGSEKELKRLKSSRVQKRIREEVLQEHPEKNYWERVNVASVSSQENKWMEGKSLAYISSQINKDPVDTLFHILIEERLRVSAIYFSMSEENMRRILKKPYTMIGSDSSTRSDNGITAKGKPHPRGFGTFPRVLGRYVREEGILTLEEAIYKMTGFTARRYGIKSRGLIREDYYADITVFDPERINDRSIFDNPFLYPDGIVYVIVNGIPVVEDGELKGTLPGRVFKNG